MRNLEIVANKIIEIINKHYDNEKKEECVREIQKVIESTRYSAPETLPLRWESLSDILMFYLFPIDTTWKEEIRKLFANEIKIEEINDEETS